MLDSCLPRLPSGTEKGVFYALDFGGTNFRVVRVSMCGSSITTNQFKYSLVSAAPYPKGLLDAKASATEMFDFFASCLKSRMEYYGDVPPNSSLNNTDGSISSYLMPVSSGNQFHNKNQISQPRGRSASWFSPTPEDDISQNGYNEDETEDGVNPMGFGCGSPMDTSNADNEDDNNEYNNNLNQINNLNNNNNNDHLYPVGFTFSFPCFQKTLSSAVLVQWTKDFLTGRETPDDPVEGKDVGLLLSNAFRRQNVNAILVAVVNDTVGTLVSGAFETTSDPTLPPVGIGLIVGTGINACYVDPAGDQYRYSGKVINIECGNFDRELPLTSIDYEMDFVDRTNRSKQLLEKMISGAYMGEISRRTIVRVLQNEATAEMWSPYSLSSSHCASIAQDTSDEFTITQKVVKDVWGAIVSSGDKTGLSSINKDVIPIIHKVCWMIMDRAAGLSAVIVAATARRYLTADPSSVSKGVTVAIDGSLYKCVNMFRQRFRFYLELLLGQEIANSVNCVISDDGSGKGAALIAALVFSS